MNIKETILSATNYGLDIIIRYYPEAGESLFKRQAFKLREEKTASSAIKLFDNCYWIKDFGSGKSYSCFDIVMDKERLDFSEALKFIIKSYQLNIPGYEGVATVCEPIKEFRAAKAEEVEGESYFDIKDHFSHNELRELFSDKVFEKYKKDTIKLEQVCKRFNLYALNSITKIKGRKATIIKSTEHFPIFLYDHGDFKKVYKPKEQDKKWRFYYIGQKPTDFIFGLNQLTKSYKKRKEDLEDEKSESVDGTEADKKKREPKLKHAILCSGERDALNVAALSPENNVLCLNSESAKLKEFDFNNINTMVESFYNIPDIDATGLSKGHDLAMQYLDIKTIWLPKELNNQKDFRGGRCKDVRDYFKYYTMRSFDDLMRTAMPYRFWDVYNKNDKQGVFVKKDFSFNNLHAYNFLNRNGFSRFKDENNEEGYVFVHINGNVVKKVKAFEMKDYINHFLFERNAETDLRNMVFKTSQVKDASLGNLPIKEIEFKDFDKDYQYMFFQNKVWCITKNEVQEFEPGTVSRFVWDNEVIKHDVSKLPDFFKVTYNKEDDLYDIDILDDSSILFKFLQNTTNMHWRVTEYGVSEIVDGKETVRKILNPIEEYENKLHLINRFFSLGYLMHRYKDASRAWAVYAMENKVIKDSESNGGSGKSVTLKIPLKFMTGQNVDARPRDLFEKAHWTHNVTEHTDYVHFEDAAEYFDFKRVFNLVASDFPVNPKNLRPYDIPYELSPKISISSNYALQNQDSSTLRRILYTVFSDYYHHGPNEEFVSARSPKDDFGKQLFTDFDEKDWNQAINLMAQCIKLYMNFEKIDPPMQNVIKRKFISEMGDAFLDWADVYFSKESERLNTHVVKDFALNDYIQVSKHHKFTAQRFKKALKAYAMFRNYDFNPVEYVNDEGRIIEKHKDATTGIQKSVEMVHFRTKDYKSVINTTPEIFASTTDINNADDTEDKLPF